MRQLKISKSITSKDAESLDKYLNEISKHQLISAEEETTLAQRIRAGDQQAVKELTTANLRFVVSVAKQYQNRGLGLADMINEGNLGLIKAAQRFDETRGFKFISYAVWWIRQSIMQALSEQSRIIRLPLNKLGVLSKIRKAESILEQQLERPASVEELAESLSISVSEISITLNAAQNHVSADAGFAGNEDLSLIDVVSDPMDEKPDSFLMASSLSIEIKRALSTLTDRESDVLILFYGIGLKDSLTYEEIGNKYDLSRERVRQIKEQALRRLKMTSRNRFLKTYLG
ncbi:MAG: RNA polymerase sigma factor RpoD/SigA [Bacteroidota bacterium]|nr:RNA polymerase sigma factor RpoD/SigA [Bacteroidota bacterium]